MEDHAKRILVILKDLKDSGCSDDEIYSALGKYISENFIDKEEKQDKVRLLGSRIKMANTFCECIVLNDIDGNEIIRSEGTHPQIEIFFTYKGYNFYSPPVKTASRVYVNIKDVEFDKKVL